MPATAACLPVPLGIHIDAATNSKIWSNQFVDLSIYYLHKRPNLSIFNWGKKKEKKINKKKRGKFGLSSLYTAGFWSYVYKQYLRCLGEYAARRYDQQMFRKWRQSIRLPWNVIN